MIVGVDRAYTRSLLSESGCQAERKIDGGDLCRRLLRASMLYDLVMCPHRVTMDCSVRSLRRLILFVIHERREMADLSGQTSSTSQRLLPFKNSGIRKWGGIVEDDGLHANQQLLQRIKH